MRAGVLGGTFDPPHLAHLVLAAAARETLGLDRVLFVPAGVPWRKADREVTSAALRVRMAEAAVADLDWAEVSTIEVEREGPSYASETMRGLSAQGGEWWFVLGADALADLPNWHEPEALLAVARLAVGRRGNDDPRAQRGLEPDGPETVIGKYSEPERVAAQSERERRQWLVRNRLPAIETRIDYIPMPPIDVSSSELRARVRAGRSTDVWLPAAVRNIIDAEGLYRA